MLPRVVLVAIACGVVGGTIEIIWTEFFGFSFGLLCDVITSNPLDDAFTLDDDCVAIVGKDFLRSEGNDQIILFYFGDI